MVRWLKIVLVLSVAIWGVIGALGNLTNLEIAYRSVETVTSMGWMGDGAGPPWRTTNPVVIGLGTALIVVGKIAAAAFCSLGAAAMIRSVSADVSAFQVSKRFALVGMGSALVMLFLGFTVVAETAYLIFLDQELVHAGEAAFRYGGFIALILIFVAQPEPS